MAQQRTRQPVAVASALLDVVGRRHELRWRNGHVDGEDADSLGDAAGTLRVETLRAVHRGRVAGEKGLVGRRLRLLDEQQRDQAERELRRYEVLALLARPESRVIDRVRERHPTVEPEPVLDQRRHRHHVLVKPAVLVVGPQRPCGLASPPDDGAGRAELRLDQPADDERRVVGVQDGAAHRRSRDVEHRRLASVGVETQPVADEQRAVEVVQAVDLLRHRVEPATLVADEPVVGALVRLTATDVPARRLGVDRRGLAHHALEQVAVAGQRQQPLAQLADGRVLEHALDQLEQVPLAAVPVQLVSTDVPCVAGLLHVGADMLPQVRAQLLIVEWRARITARQRRQHLCDGYRHAVPHAGTWSFTRGRSSSHSA